MTLTSKAKLLLIMARPYEYVQTLTLLLMGQLTPILVTWPTEQVLCRPCMPLIEMLLVYHMVRISAPPTSHLGDFFHF